MDHFGDHIIVLNAFSNQLEAWRPKSDYNKQNFVFFASFLKRLLKAFEYLGFEADLQNSTLTKKAKEKITQNILIKWTEYTITSIGNQPTVSDFQKWLEIKAQVNEKITRENVYKPFNNQNNFGHHKNNLSRINNNSDNRNNNDTIQISTNALNNWKQNSLSSNPPANQHIQPLVSPRKSTEKPNTSFRKSKGSHILASCPEY